MQSGSSEMAMVVVVVEVEEVVVPSSMHAARTLVFHRLGYEYRVSKNQGHPRSESRQEIMVQGFNR